MRKVVVTGLGFASSIGSCRNSVITSLLDLRHGFVPFPVREGELRAPKWYGSVKDYTVEGWDPEDWAYPSRFEIPQSELKSMSPGVLYAHCATRDALRDAQVSEEEASCPMTGLYSASGGSAGRQHQQLTIMEDRGLSRCSPYSVVSSTVGTINFNLGASLKIRGALCGFASACASSAHALGLARDAIALGRQDRMIVLGAEDCTREMILPFATMRALSQAEDAESASCPFDVRRSGFVGSGGATTLILEAADLAESRGAPIYAELGGWGEAGDGHSPAMPHPDGRGLVEAMRRALREASLAPEAIDYVNAHATATPVGDRAELRALKTVFGERGKDGPAISSTKGLTGHPLSMSGALEGAICCLALKEDFIPGSAHIEKLDAEAEGLNVVTKSSRATLNVAQSNSSGFGGSNVSLIFRRWGS